MHYLRTKEATDWEREPKTPSFFDSNLDYRGKWHLVKEWLIEFVEYEFSEYGSPWREIGLDHNGEPVLAGPDDTNYGFWCDTNLTWKDVVEKRFVGEEISKVEFEKAWESYIENVRRRMNTEVITTFELGRIQINFLLILSL